MMDAKCIALRAAAAADTSAHASYNSCNSKMQQLQQQDADTTAHILQSHRSVFISCSLCSLSNAAVEQQQRSSKAAVKRARENLQRS